MRRQYVGIPALLKGTAVLCLCIILAGVIVSTVFESAAGATAKGPPPVINEFSASPMVLPDGQAAVYTFAVGGATKVEIIEAGDIIKEVNGPATANIKGTIKGRTTYQIRTGDSKTFDTTLVAVNSNGKQMKKLTLSFATVTPPGTASTASGQAGSTDNATGARSPKWLGKIISPVLSTPPAGFSQSTWPPTFGKCSKDCDYCLRSEDAKDRGFTQQCSDQPCYYSPDKQQIWYCYSKPATIWCCSDGKVVETVREKCIEAGGTAYATQAEAIKACPSVGGCCANGNVSQSTQAQCVQIGGKWYSTISEATSACPAVGGCCANGKYFSANQAQCYEVGGRWYTSLSEATAACQVSGGCCYNGRVAQSTQTQCAQVGGRWYASVTDATEACQPIGGCCANGKALSATQSQCYQYGGRYYSTLSEATAACQPVGGCCANGRAFSATQAQCSEYGGRYYSSLSAATTACEPPLCWCCAGGKTFQTTQTQCTRSGGSCYSSQSAATKACTYRTPTLK